MQDDQFQYEMEQEMQVQFGGHRVEEFGAGGEDGEAERMRMSGDQPGGSWVTEGESGQMLKSAAAHKRAAAEARKKAAMETLGL